MNHTRVTTLRGFDLHAVYARQAAAFDRHRSRAPFECRWLDRLIARTGPGDTILDVGCGNGEPIARYLVEQGRRVCGVDFAGPMLEIARRPFPSEWWLLGDMRGLELRETFAGVIARDSFFHLPARTSSECACRASRATSRLAAVCW